MITKNNRKGFTIVELLVVIAIIGILATIGIINYGGWSKSIAETQIKNDLNGAATAMENSRNFGDSYPLSIPSTFKPSKDVTLSGGSTDGGVTYCVDAVSSQFPDLNYFISNSKEAQLGTCAK